MTRSPLLADRTNLGFLQTTALAIIERLDPELAAEPAETAHGNAQRLTRILILLVHARHALQTLASKFPIHGPCLSNTSLHQLLNTVIQ